MRNDASATIGTNMTIFIQNFFLHGRIAGSRTYRIFVVIGEVLWFHGVLLIRS